MYGRFCVHGSASGSECEAGLEACSASESKDNTAWPLATHGTRDTSHCAVSCLHSSITPGKARIQPGLRIKTLHGQTHVGKQGVFQQLRIL